MSYKSRKDNRSDKEFAKDLKKFHKQEAVYAEAYRLQLEDEFGDKDTNVVYTPRSADPTGDVVYKHLPKDVFDAKYYLCTSEGKKKGVRKVEIKTAPPFLTKFFTFKVSSLERCVKYNSWLVLCQTDNLRTASAKECEKMLNDFDHQIYERFSPNDLAVRIYDHQFDDYLSKAEWCSEAAELIKENENLLK